MNKTMSNEYATIINDNRYIANAQLTADDLGPTMWKEYRQVCDVIAISAWKSLSDKSADTDILGAAIAGLFDFFGSDAKATVPMQKRFILACVQVRKEQSVAMKKARKALREARNVLEEEEAREDKDETRIQILQAKVDEAQEEVTRLEGEPMNVWFNKTPMLDTTHKHASAKCRKLIEDTMADVMAERALMTIEEMQEEALQLKAARKARKQMKAQAEANNK